MRYLALLRHGDTEGRGLSHHGRMQAETLGLQLLRLELSAERVSVVTSPALRARQTAALVGKLLGIHRCARDPRLWSGPGGHERSYDLDSGELLESLDSPDGNPELLVLVTHMEICQDLPPRLVERYGSQGPAVTYIGRGCGVLYDLKRGTHALIG